MVRSEFYDPASGLDGTQYNVTLSYAIGDLAALTVVTSGLSGIGLNATVSEVTFSGSEAIIDLSWFSMIIMPMTRETHMCRLTVIPNKCHAHDRETRMCIPYTMYMTTFLLSWMSRDYAADDTYSRCMNTRKLPSAAVERPSLRYRREYTCRT